MPNSDPCQIITPLVLVGLGLGVGAGLGLGNQIQIGISTIGVIIWQGVENGHNGKASGDYHRRLYSPEANEPLAAGDYRRLSRYLLKHSTVLDLTRQDST